MSSQSRYAAPKEKPEAVEVQGQAASSYEVRAAKAFDTLKIPFIFQYRLFGGRNLLGGRVIDFLALTVPLSTPVEIHGEYWHQPYLKSSDDEILRGILKSLGGFAELVIIWGVDLQTDEDTLAAFRRELGL